VGVRERPQRRELDHGHGLALEQHRKNDQISRRRRSETRGDPHIVTRDVGQQNRAFLDSALTHQSVAKSQTRPFFIAHGAGIAREHGEIRRAGA